MKIGDWFRYVSYIDGIKHTVAGPITRFVTINKTTLAVVKTSNGEVCKLLTNLRRMTKSEVVLWKLEN